MTLFMNENAHYANCVSPEMSSRPAPPTTPDGAASLLLSLPAIVSQEISKECIDWDDDLHVPALPVLDVSAITAVKQPRLKPNPSSSSPSLLTPRFFNNNSREVSPSNDKGSTSNSGSARARSVSVDDIFEDLATYHRRKQKKAPEPEQPPTSDHVAASDTTPPTHAIPSSKRTLPTRKSVLARYASKQQEIRRAMKASSLMGKPSRNQAPKPPAIKTILRKKFSWKNYPELEAFLIANRSEYLRHSALNYTIQQKQYNNRLTEKLLELAAEHGYVFDESCFNFVTVRDRIRCYFKSYVQSAKKRGQLIGYAAKKAGLLKASDLHPEQPGDIVLPSV